MLIVAVERLVIKFMVFAEICISVEDWCGVVTIVLSDSVVNAVSVRVSVDAPGVHRWSLNFVRVDSLLVVARYNLCSDRGMSWVYVSFIIDSSVSLMRLIVTLDNMDLLVEDGGSVLLWSVRSFTRVEIAALIWMGNLVVLAVERQSLVSHVSVLDSVLCLCLDLVEELIILVLNVVHDLGSAVIVDIVAVSVARVVLVRQLVMSEVLIKLVSIHVGISTIEWAALMVLWVLNQAGFVVSWLVVVSTEVLKLLVAVLIVVRNWVANAVIKNVLAISQVRFEDWHLSFDGMSVNSMVVVMLKLCWSILVVDNTL